MTSVSLLQILTTIATFFQTQGGVLLVIIGICLGAVDTLFHHRWASLGIAIFAGAVLLSAGWISTTWLGGQAVGGG